MGIWRDLKDGIRDAAIGLQCMGREHATNADVAAVQRALEEGKGKTYAEYYEPEPGEDPTAERPEPDMDEGPQDWNDLREEQRDEWDDEIRPHEYAGNGRAREECGFMEDSGWMCTQPREGHPAPEMPARELGE